MKFLKKFLPQGLKLTLYEKYRFSVLAFYIESLRDARRYLHAAEFSALPKRKRKEHLEADIVRLYHQIEKGLAMPDFRPRFGLLLVKGLLARLEEWKEMAGKGRANGGAVCVQAAYTALYKYWERHQSLGVDVSDLIPAAYTTAPSVENLTLAGIKKAEPVSAADREAFHRVVQTRASVRAFDPQKQPPRETIERAVRAAIRSPSVCNRQTCRVHIFSGERAQKVLSLQNGNRGFGHRIPVVLVPTSDMRYLTETGERYQSWIDGGLFSMTLLLALHAEGLGAVSLNWCVFNGKDKAFRAVTGIPDYERIMMLVGCGYPEEGSFVPLSDRRPIEDIIRWDPFAGVKPTRSADLLQ